MTRPGRAITRILRDSYGSPDLGNHRDPLDELIFILLSQMTTGPSYSRVFLHLKSAVGTWEDARHLTVEELETLIKDAGLSRRKAACMRDIFERLESDFGAVSLDGLEQMDLPSAERYLTSLPGIGRKSAKCVLLFSLGRPVVPVDTHVGRLAWRMGLVSRNPSSADVHDELEAAIPPTDRLDFHVNAVMHGRSVCRARHPRCGECVLRSLCSSPVPTA